MADIEKPIEVYCPICGFHEALNEDENLVGLSRSDKVKKIQTLQASNDPYFTCAGCEDPKESAKILEIR